MPIGSSSVTRTILSGAAVSDKLDMRGVKVLAVYVPTLTSGTVKLQGSYDGATWADLKDTAGTTLEFGTSTGGFWMDADYVARFLSIPFLRLATGGNQGADRVFRITTARE
jgi:hypothetical protein